MNNLPNLPQQDMEQVLAAAPNITCDSCGNGTFHEVVVFKHLSELLSPNGKAGAVPIPTFACNACGGVNDIFLPAFLRTTKIEPATTVETPQQSKIEIVR